MSSSSVHTATESYHTLIRSTLINNNLIFNVNILATQKLINWKYIHRFKIQVQAYNSTGDIEIVLGDRQIRTIIGKRAYNE